MRQVAIRIAILAVALGLSLGCATAPAPAAPATLTRTVRAAGARSPAVRWPPPAPKPLRAHLETGAVTLDVDANGVRATVEGRDVFRLKDDLQHAFTRIDRGFMTRLEWPSALSHADRTDHLEVFRGSPIVSLFTRVWTDESVAPHPWSFSMPATYDHLFRADGSRFPSTITLSSTTADPFVIVANREATEGLIFFFPLPPERRQWREDDYSVLARPSITFSAQSGAVQIGWTELAQAEPDTTFDASVYVMPFSGPLAAALPQIRFPLPASAPGYWSPLGDVGASGQSVWNLRMLRYHPEEHASWIDGGNENYAFTKPGGYVWGDLTMSMKGVRTAPLSERAIERDFAFRTSTFFVEAGRQKGAPPNLTMQPRFAQRFAVPAAFRTVVFCQYWQYRLPELAELLRSPHLTEDEKSELYADVQRARAVYDPSAQGTWTRRIEGGAVWFEYLDVPFLDAEPWILNTHVTSVGNVGELAKISAQRDQASDLEFWTSLFRAGIDGIFHVTEQDEMWTDEDPNELRYALNDAGHRSYHYYMLTSWLTPVLEHAFTLAPQRVRPLMDLMRRLQKARFLQEDERGRSGVAIAAEVLGAAEVRLRATPR